MSDGAVLDSREFDAMLAELRELPPSMRKRVMRGTVATGASVIRVEAKARAPQWTGSVAAGHPPPGTLRKAIYQARITRECTETIEAWLVGVRSGKGSKADAYYARWVEYGHYARAAKADRKAVRSGERMVEGAQYVLPQPFMRPAFEAKKAEAVQAMQAYLDQNLAIATATFRYLRARS